MSRADRTSLAEFLGDAIVYRRLAPLDERLPRYEELARRIGLPPDTPPRKCQPDYARVVACLLRAAAELHDMPGPIERLLLVGDTPGNDVTAFHQLCAETGWPGVAFVGRDDTTQPEVWKVREHGDQIIVTASRWRLLEEIDVFCTGRGFAIDRQTAVIIDIDKTAIGARGRNDEAIDGARIDALQRTFEQFLDTAPTWDACRELYNRLNRPALHHLTADNQDTIAILCLAVEGGLISSEILADDASRRFLSLVQLMHATRQPFCRPPTAAREIYHRLREGAHAGVLPEFEAFRRNEYEATVRRMDHLPDDAPREQRMMDEITITAEVRDAALRWRDRGAHLLGLSDKPDTASLPTTEMAAAGLRPLHRTEARVLGGI